jgi:excisionase family DNA binding protein
LLLGCFWVGSKRGKVACPTGIYTALDCSLAQVPRLQRARFLSGYAKNRALARTILGPLPGTLRFTMRARGRSDEISNDQSDRLIFDQLLSVAQAAARLGVAQVTLRRWIRLRLVPSVRLGRARRIRLGDVEALIRVGLDVPIGRRER